MHIYYKNEEGKEEKPMEYQKAKAEVVLFDNSDVVTKSCNGEPAAGPGNNNSNKEKGWS